MGSPRIVWGYEAVNAFSPSQRQAVVTDFSEVVNPHMAICGDTGSGKTYTLLHAISQVIQSSAGQVRFHVFDVHGDIEPEGQYTSMVKFSESSPYGFNPLLVNPDPDAGGVRKAVQNFISTLKLSPTHGRSLGPKQQDILRNLMLDVYAQAGFDQDSPRTWSVKSESAPAGLSAGRIYVDIPFSEKDLAKEEAKACGISLTFDSSNKCWHVDEYRDGIMRWPRKRWGVVNPTLNDLCKYAARRREMSFTGLGQKEADRLDAVHSRAKALNRALTNALRSRNNNGSDSEQATEELEALDKAKDEALQAFEKYFEVLEHGHAMNALLTYDSYESLSTVKQILDSLNSSGVFRDESPNFDPRKPIWRYHIKNLTADEQKFLVNFRLREIFYAAVQRGDSGGELREIILIDEGAKFVEKDEAHILNVIALEARKFGLGIWFASQSPTHYPEALMSSMATKVILGLDPTFWRESQAKLRIDPDDMKWIKPREGLLLNRKLKGVGAQNWSKIISWGKIHS